MAETFHDARLKLRRAKEHIDDLERKMRDFAPNDSHSLLVQYDAKRGCDVIYVESGKPIPDDFPLILGDALHNLRAALDFAISDVEFTHTGRRNHKTSFLIRETRDQLLGAVNGGFKAKAPRPIIDYIVDTIQPYATGNGRSFWALHCLDITDKHQLIIPHMQVRVIYGIRFVDERNEQVQVPNWMVSNNRTANYRCLGHRNIKITDKGKSSLAIVFNQGVPKEGRLILPTLREFQVHVGAAIDGIEAVFLAVWP